MGTENMKVQAAPLMSDLQRQVLDSYLGGAAKMMQGFKFGVPWGGPTSASYTPQDFIFSTELPTYHDPWADGDDNDDDNDDDGNTPPSKKPQPRPRPIPGPGPVKLQSKESPMAAFLTSLKPTSTEARLPGLLTSPFSSPFRYQMTGKLPRGYY